MTRNSIMTLTILILFFVALLFLFVDAFSRLPRDVTETYHNFTLIYVTK